MLFDSLPERVAHGYLLVAFFVLPTTAMILSGGTRPVGPAVQALLLTVVGHHTLFLAVAVMD